jgi:hypothetical protein
MEKHANTIFPQDRVVVTRGNEKVASGSAGRVQDIDAGMELAQVTFDDGRTEFVDLSSLRKEDG